MSTSLVKQCSMQRLGRQRESGIQQTGSNPVLHVEPRRQTYSTARGSRKSVDSPVRLTHAMDCTWSISEYQNIRMSECRNVGMAILPTTGAHSVLPLLGFAAHSKPVSPIF